MKRREFLRLGGGASLAFLINGMPISAFADTPLLRLLAKQTAANGRVLVLIQLIGGNDGLNTIIPLDRYSELSNARSNILIPQAKVLKLSGTTTTGFNPAMTAIQDMYNNGMMSITQGVSYPNPNFSHFRATDIWNSGASATQYLNTGWLGRFLDQEYANFPVGYPNSNMPDPLAIQIGTSISPVLQGPSVSMGTVISGISSFYNIVNGTVDPAPATPAGHELTFIRYISQQTQAYTTVISNAANKSTTLSTKYPAASARNNLADQLKIVARLISGGLQTPVYVVNIGSFDTHSQQVDPTDHTVGTQATLLGQLSDAVAAFYDDLKLMGIDHRVAAMTFSEFGRRILSNASGGTDHGTSEPVMVFGKDVIPGIIGTSPVLPTNATVNDNLPMQYDYRSIYASALSDWFGVSSTILSNVMMAPYPILPIFQKNVGVNETSEQGSTELLGQCYPNPVRGGTTINFSATGTGETTIQLFDMDGRLVRTLTQQEFSRGQHQITLDCSDLAPGNYIYRLSTTQGEHAARKMLVME